MKKQLLIVVALVVLLALVAASGAGAAKSKKAAAHKGGKEGAALMRVIADKAVVGASVLRYRGRKGGQLTGWVIVTGLPANSTLAWHIHGRVPGGDPAPGNCKTQSDGVIVPFDDLVANANGVAVVRINMKKVGKNPLLKGNYVNIHEMSSADGVGPSGRCSASHSTRSGQRSQRQAGRLSRATSLPAVTRRSTSTSSPTTQKPSASSSE